MSGKAASEGRRGERGAVPAGGFAPRLLCARRQLSRPKDCAFGWAERIALAALVVGADIVARLKVRALSFASLAVFLMAADAFAQTAQLAPIPMPFPFPQGSSIFQWDYQCIGQKGCGFTGFGLDRLTLRSASIILSRLKVGEIEIPTYFIWGTLLDGSVVVGMTQNELSFRFSAVNMRLIAAGSPGL